MAWNEPNDKNKKKDSWSGNEQSPPDLDEALKRFQKKLRGAIGGGNRGGSNTGTDGNGGMGLLFALVATIAVVFWFLSGIFIVDPAERAVVLRFGKYVETVGPGPHWIPRFIENKIIRNVDRRLKFSYSAQMLTKDENIVQVAIAVQYRIGDLKSYLFNVSDPIESLEQATASALRQVVGHTTLDEIITKGRERWGASVEDLLKEILVQYKAGIIIAKVSPQPARAPEKVQDAFDDAINAQEDEKRFKEKAFAYRAKVLPIAKGNARRVLEEAEGDSREVVLRATGAVAEFLALLPEYKNAPNIMRERMYIDTMQQVLSQSSKILIDSSSGNLLYLPLEKLLSSANKTEADNDEVKVIESTTLGANKLPSFNKRGRGLGRLGSGTSYGRNF